MLTAALIPQTVWTIRILPRQLAKKYSPVSDDLPLLYCSTGIGISIAANKMRGIRCCVCSDTYSAKYTRMHNNANALSMGGKVVGAGLAAQITDIFLSTEFEGGRHQRRIDKITAIEENR